MSGFAAFLNEDQITFATDTLVTKDSAFPHVAVNSLSKVNYYPHLDCCVVALGYSSLGDDYYKFIQNSIFSTIDQLITNTKLYFLKTLDFSDYPEHLHDTLEDAEGLGNLYVMGHCRKLKKLVAYNVIVDKVKGIKVVDMRTDFRMFVHPPISNEDTERIVKEVESVGGTYGTAMIKFVQQMAQDTHEKEKFTVAVGLEIHLTSMTLSKDGQFSCAFCSPYKFPNFDEEIKKMITQRNVVRWTKQRLQELKDKAKMFAEMAEFFTVKTESNHIESIKKV